MTERIELPAPRVKPRPVSEPTAWVRAVLPRLREQEFTRLQLSTLAHDRFPGLRWEMVSNSISHEIRQAVKDGRIEVVSDGPPRRYRNTEAAASGRQ